MFCTFERRIISRRIQPRQPAHGLVCAAKSTYLPLECEPDSGASGLRDPLGLCLCPGDIQETVRHRIIERQLTHDRSEEHTSELQSPCNLVCRLLLEKKKKKQFTT